jgi:dCTP deaminase
MEAAGILPSQAIARAVADGWIRAPGDSPVPPGNLQPASLDLRLGDMAHRLRCSFLPDSASTVEERLGPLSLDAVDLRGGAVLERNRPYLIPLVEELALPPDVRGRTNPKSSTGRLDVFTRVITDGGERFDEIRRAYRGRLWLEVVSRSFAVRAHPGLALNQLRLIRGDARCADAGILALHEREPLLFDDAGQVPARELALADGLFLRIDLTGTGAAGVGYKARRNAGLLDLGRVGGHDPRNFWEPVQAEAGSRVILEPEEFYLLLSSERVRIPPGVAAEMSAYDPTAGELRTHYAGFFDPGFGYSREGSRAGTRAVLEVRAHDVPFMVEHGQRVCKLGFERMEAAPDLLYGREIGSSYQDQQLTLSKHFRAGGAEGEHDSVTAVAQRGAPR